MTNKELARQIAHDIDVWSLQELDGGFRNHLGASIIGHSCSRYLWYTFRWVKKEVHPARLLRLFNRGHREEPFMVKMLKGIGCQIWDVDTTLPVNEKGEHPQFRISNFYGHYGGSLDAIAILPQQYNYTEPLSVSFKTNATGTGFNNLSIKGLLLTKPQHHIQESVYCYYKGYKKYLYINVNKNDDSLFIDIQDADWNEARRQDQKAERIIFSRTPPTKIAENSSFSECQICQKKAICHENALPEKNCRSCKYAIPVENSKWYCEGYKDTIPDNIIRLGCDQWHPITYS